MIIVSWPLHERVWYFMSPQTNIQALLLIQKIVEIVRFHIMPTLDLGRHRNLERLRMIFGQLTVTTRPKKHVIFHIFEEK